MKKTVTESPGEKKQDRRDVMRAIGAGVVGAVALAAGPVADKLEAATSLKAPGGSAGQWGMLIDLKRCIGCQACTIACKAENDVPLGVFRRRVRTVMENSYPDTARHFVPISCFHCADPACLKKCPKKAIYKSAEGLVLVDEKKCEKKKVCTIACPYRNIFIDPLTSKADKCTFCEHRVKEGVVPACVQTCTGGALMFGDVGDSGSDISKAIKSANAKVLKPDAGTSPSVYYAGLESGLEKKLTAMLKKRGQLKPATLEADI